jgi:hypothetical protein
LNAKIADRIGMLATLNVSDGARLAELELKLGDPVDTFWGAYEQRSREQRRPIIEAIAAAIDDEYAPVTIGSMGALFYHDVERIVVCAGGKSGWITGIQHLLGFRFLGLPSSLPQSAKLVMSTDDSAMTMKTICRSGKARIESEPLGQYLERNNQLAQCIIPKYRLLAAIEETADYTKNVITYSDKKRVNSEIWAWIFSTYAYTGTCVVLRRHLAKQLKRLFPGGCVGAPWFQSLKYRSTNGIRPNAEVRQARDFMHVCTRACGLPR